MQYIQTQVFNFGGQILDAKYDIKSAEIIGIIKTIAFLQKQTVFTESKMVHVHHVDNANALLWAMHLAENIKSGGMETDYADFTTKLLLPPEHTVDAAMFVLALKNNDIIFRHQKSHTGNEDDHIGAILNRAADEQCNNYKKLIMETTGGKHSADMYGSTLNNMKRQMISKAREAKNLTKPISITPGNI